MYKYKVLYPQTTGNWLQIGGDIHAKSFEEAAKEYAETWRNNDFNEGNVPPHPVMIFHNTQLREFRFEPPGDIKIINTGSAKDRL